MLNLPLMRLVETSQSELLHSSNIIYDGMNQGWPGFASCLLKPGMKKGVHGLHLS